MRLIDADALIKDIAKSIRLADEWEKESHEKKDKIGLKYAIDTRRSLLSMISRIKEAPTVEPEERHGRWIEKERYNLHGDEYCDCLCSECCHRISRPAGFYPDYCEDCGTRMDGGAEHATD